MATRSPAHGNNSCAGQAGGDCATNGIAETGNVTRVKSRGIGQIMFSGRKRKRGARRVRRNRRFNKFLPHAPSLLDVPDQTKVWRGRSPRSYLNQWRKIIQDCGRPDGLLPSRVIFCCWYAVGNTPLAPKQETTKFAAPNK
jgi:hypothetical protein